MSRSDFSSEARIQIRQRLSDLVPVFARAAVGDFSQDVKMPDEEDELVEFYAGVQLMLEVVREQLKELKDLNQSLEKKVEERTAEILLKNELLKTQAELYETLLHAQSERGKGAIYIKTATNFVKIDPSDILFIRSLSDYVIIQTSCGKYTFHSTMKAMLARLPVGEFLRIHHSYIVRLDKISRTENGFVYTGDYQLPVSRSKKAALNKQLKLYAGMNS